MDLPVIFVGYRHSPVRVFGVHTEAANAFEHYWYMWKLPMFGEKDVDRILAEAGACHRAHPAHHVRLVGYDNFAQFQGAAMVIHQGS